MTNAKEPPMRTTGVASLTLTAPPVITAAEGAAWVEVGTVSGVEVAATVARLELGVGLMECTLINVFVIVVVEIEVVISAATS